MRISGGSAKGRRISPGKALPKGAEECGLRPTSAKVREAVFDILRSRMAGASFLDLYAGTGAVGIEALSQGAGKAVFVDDNPRMIALIGELIDKFGFRGKATLIRDKAAAFIKRSASVFDIVFADPPYESGELETVLPLIDKSAILGENSIVMAEHASRHALPASIGGLELARRYKYGDTSLSVYRRRKERP